MASGRRVVVTGLGLVSPLGNDVETSWSALLRAENGITSIPYFDTTQYASRIAGIVKDFDGSRYFSVKDLRKTDLFVQYGVAAAEEAIANSGLDFSVENSDRVGTAIGSGIGGLPGIEENFQKLISAGPRKISPFFIPSIIINMCSGQVSLRHGLTGPSIAAATACATGTHNIGLAARMIAYGDADIMICGGAEMATSPIGMGGFAAMRALSTRNDDPEHASRPWDKDRDGFVLAEGAGALVLEDYDHARARGAEIYAELAGFGMSSDAYHITLPEPDGKGAASAMRNALTDAQLAPEKVDYINAHATSTVAGDVGEAKAIQSIFGTDTRIPVSGTKSMTGHMLGAAGAAEAIFSILALRDQVIPPTKNLFEPDEGCTLDFVPHTARDAKLSVTLSNSFGFGGTNSALIFKSI